MFERFTERARQVVVRAQEEARGLNHNYVGTEHLLLGLLRLDEGVAVDVLDRVGLTIETVRGAVTRVVGLGAASTPGQMPFTPRAKAVLEQSLKLSQALGDGAIFPEHILLALADVSGGVAHRLLLDAGADAAALPSLVVTLRAADPSQGPLTRDARRMFEDRAAVVEAQILAFERRADVVEAVAETATREDAEKVIARRFKLSPRQARAVLAVRLGEWTSEEIDVVRQELVDLRARLDSEDAQG
jgi:ATP-dependent Clp protease ATP-binding subunit ClpA